MIELVTNIKASLPFLAGLSDDMTIFIVLLVVGVVVLTFASLYAGVTSVVERRIAGRIQSRIGPNYVFFKGLLQFLADGIKAIQKEDIIPDEADQPLFRVAPYLVFMSMLGAWVAIPFGQQLIPADINIGILYIFAISGLNVLGILMAGWGSNNKWSLIGGMRSAAQIVSYEIPSGLSALTVILLTGSLSMQQIIQGQGAWPWEWYLTQNPFTAAAFFVMFTSLLAEGNRVPFDLPEAESELVSGYNTEYSGMRFLMFFFAEWANIYVVSAVLTTLFLGGWNSPFEWIVHPFGMDVELSGVFFFVAKALLLTFVVIWVRWTLPRLRVDQLMAVCWKYLIPISFVNVIGVLVWFLIFPEGSHMASWIITGFFGLVGLLFFYKVVVVNLIRMKAKLDFNPLH